MINHLKPRKLLELATVLLALGVVQSCAPRPVYRMPLPPASIARPPTQAPEPISPEPIPPEPVRVPLPLESTIKEQDVTTKEVKRPPLPKETPRTESAVPETPQPPLQDDSSLLAKLTPSTPPHRAASLRLTEEGRKLLEARDYAKALNRLEKTIVIDSTNPYGYFYLAKVHHVLGRYKESLNFLDVAESRFSGEPFWLAEVHALRGENFRALGMSQKAEASYAEALRLNSGNRTAADAISRPQAGSPPIPR
jgi:predicted negative regulator of RcsB-dependent stress response